MSQTNNKPCIQERIMTRLSRRSPEFFLIVSIAILAVALLILENSPYPYSNYLSKLKYNQIKDLVTLIVTTDGFIIAFTGVIASMILKQVFEREKEGKGKQTIAINSGEKRAEGESNYYKEKRHEIIKFVLLILITLVISIWFSLSVIITQYFPFSIGSVIGLFTGLIELVGLIYYSLKI